MINHIETHSYFSQQTTNYYSFKTFEKAQRGLLINFHCSNIFYEGQQTFVTNEYAKLPSK